MQTDPGPAEIRAEIARANLMKYSVAAEAGRHPATVARWLSGKQAMPAGAGTRLLEAVQRLAKAQRGR
jgi:hypothetical protein